MTIPHKIAPASPVVVEKPVEKKKDADPFGGLGPLLYCYMCMYHAVQTSRDTARIQAKEVQNTAAEENKVIGLEAQEKFASLNVSNLESAKLVSDATGPIVTKHEVENGREPVGWIGPWATHYTVIDHFKQEIVMKSNAAVVMGQFEAKQQLVSGYRGILQNVVSELQQNNQLKATDINSTTGLIQHSLSGASALLDLLTQLSGQIGRM